MEVEGTGGGGGTYNISGKFSAHSAEILAAGNGSIINLDSLPGGVPLTVSGGPGSGNTLNVTGTTGNDTFKISSAVVSTTVGSQAVTHQLLRAPGPEDQCRPCQPGR